MTAMLAVAVVATVLDVTLTVILLRRVAWLQTFIRVMPLQGDVPQPGEQIASFAAEGLDGARLTPAADRGTTVVAFLAPACKPSERLHADLKRQPLRVPVTAFVHTTGDQDGSTELAHELRAVGAVGMIHDDDPAVRAFRVTGYPTVFRLRRGRVIAVGHKLADIV